MPDDYDNDDDQQAQDILADLVGDNPDDDAQEQDDTSDSEAERDWRSEADKWKRLSRKHESVAKSNAEAAKKLRELEDQNKSESQRIQEAHDEAKSRADKAEASLRKWIAAAERAPEHATLAQVKAVARRVTGDSDDDLDADADELYALLAPEPEQQRAPLPGKPQERLRGGGDPDDEPEETDPRKLADSIRRH